MTIPSSKRYLNDCEQNTSSPILISPRHTNHQQHRQRTSELRKSLPPLFLGNESFSSLLSSSTSSSVSLSSVPPNERWKRTLSFRKQLVIADEPLRRMIREKQRSQNLTHAPRRHSWSTCSEHDSPNAIDSTIDSEQNVTVPIALPLHGPRMEMNEKDKSIR